jgi:hypothetical protein
MVDETIYGRGRRFSHVSRLSLGPVLSVSYYKKKKKKVVSSWESFFYPFWLWLAGCNEEL